MSVESVGGQDSPQWTHAEQACLCPLATVSMPLLVMSDWAERSLAMGATPSILGLKSQSKLDLYRSEMGKTWGMTRDKYTNRRPARRLPGEAENSSPQFHHDGLHRSELNRLNQPVRDYRRLARPAENFTASRSTSAVRTFGEVALASTSAVGTFGDAAAGSAVPPIASRSSYKLSDILNAPSESQHS